MLNVVPFFENDVIETGIEDGSTTRDVLLHVCGGGANAVVIDLDAPDAWPRTIAVAAVLAELAAGTARLLEPVLAEASLRHVLSEKELASRDRRWSLIEEAVRDEPAIYDPARRVEWIRRITGPGASRNSVIAWLRAYWRGGKSPDALVGRWNRCGAPGIPRDQDRDKKLGRPRTRGGSRGVNMSKELRRVLRSMIANLWTRNRKVTLAEVYEQVVAKVCMEPVHVPGRKEPELRPRPEYAEHGFPTREQFGYHFRTSIDSMKLRRKRRGARVFDLQSRGLPGSVVSETRGPGSRYIIDATILDVYVRSRIDPTRIVGRAVLYVVIDAWSHLIVGIYVGVENASWACAMMALANVVEDKVAYCARYGIAIEPHEWPTAGLSGRLLADGGEVAGEVSSVLSRHFNMTVETAAPYRGDLKGLCEGVFNVLPVKLAAYLPGWIMDDFRQRGARDYRLDSALDVDQVTACVINLVLHRNNNVPIKAYDRDAGMPVSEVAPYAVDLWNWGLVNRTGRQVARPAEFVRFRLMPVGIGWVDAHGLNFRGVCYLSDGMIEREWLVKGRARRFKVSLSFDPRRASRVYLHMEGTPFGYEVCSASERSRAYGEDGVTFWDVALEEAAKADLLADARDRTTTSGIETTRRVQAIVGDALERRAGLDRRSAAEQLRGIRGNRSVEVGLQRALDADGFAPESPGAGGIRNAETLVPQAVRALQAPPVEEADEDYDIDVFDCRKD